MISYPQISSKPSFLPPLPPSLPRSRMIIMNHERASNDFALPFLIRSPTMDAATGQPEVASRSLSKMCGGNSNYCARGTWPPCMYVCMCKKRGSGSFGGGGERRFRLSFVRSSSVSHDHEGRKEGRKEGMGYRRPSVRRRWMMVVRIQGVQTTAPSPGW